MRTDGRMHRQTDSQTDRRTDRQDKANCRFPQYCKSTDINFVSCNFHIYDYYLHPSLPAPQTGSPFCPRVLHFIFKALHPLSQNFGWTLWHFNFAIICSQESATRTTLLADKYVKWQ